MNPELLNTNLEHQALTPLPFIQNPEPLTLNHKPYTLHASLKISKSKP